jgi:hypothetical protein
MKRSKFTDTVVDAPLRQKSGRRCNRLSRARACGVNFHATSWFEMGRKARSSASVRGWAHRQ